MRIPYERIIQWFAGPIAALAGWLATKLVEHTSFLGQVGLGKNAIAHAIVVVGTFATTAAVTYLAHQKWMSNLAHWWDQEVGIPFPIALEDTDTVIDEPPDEPGKPPSAVTPDNLGPGEVVS